MSQAPPSARGGRNKVYAIDPIWICLTNDGARFITLGVNTRASQARDEKASYIAAVVQILVLQEPPA